MLFWMIFVGLMGGGIYSNCMNLMNTDKNIREGNFIFFFFFFSRIFFFFKIKKSKNQKIKKSKKKDIRELGVNLTFLLSNIGIMTSTLMFMGLNSSVLKACHGKQMGCLD